jgi:hypothetical protein
LFYVEPPKSCARCKSRSWKNQYTYINERKDGRHIRKIKLNPPIEQSATSGSLWNSLSSLWNSLLSTLEMKPNHSSAALHVDRFGIFTANFKLPAQLTTDQLFTYLTGAITAVVAINGALLVLPGWRRTRIQYAHLRECIESIDNDVGKSEKNKIEKKVAKYYAERKLSEDHRQMLKDKISEHYGSVKEPERYGAPFPSK